MLNEQEFMRRMKTQGTKLTDQQLKNEYRNYLKNPDSFGDLAADKKSDPFLEGLTGTAGPGAGAAKAATKPITGQAAIKQRYMQDETIEPKPKITLPIINKAQKINTALGLGDAASFPQELEAARREADARAKATQQSTIDFDNWAKMEQFNKKKREIQFNTSMTMEERDQAIHKLRNELLFKNNGESLNKKEPPSPAQDMGVKDAKKYLDDVIAQYYTYATLTDQLEKQKQDVANNIRFTSSLLDGADWAMAIAQGVNDTQQVPEMGPWTVPAKLAYGGASTLYHKYNGEPGFGDIDPNTGDDYIQRQIDKVSQKIDYVNNADYKYYISDLAMDYGPGIGTQDSFIIKLKKEVKKQQKDRPNYETQEEKEHRDAYITYLYRIIELNENKDVKALNDRFRNIEAQK